MASLLIRTKQAIELAGCTKDTLYRHLLTDPTCPSFTIGRTRFFLRDDFEAWLRAKAPSYKHVVAADERDADG